jgi:ribosomal-protein-alanine N-acetyltransferase
MSFPRLNTTRLLLREIEAKDAPALLDLYADRDHMQWYGIDPFADIAAAEARIKKLAEMRLAPNPATPWAIDLSGDFIGTCGLFAWNRSWRKCSVGYELTKTAQGHGYMQEAMSCVISWGFQQMQLNRIEAQTHPNNERSIALLGRLGFVEEGRLRQAAYWAGQYHDMLQFSLLRTEWDLKHRQIRRYST